MKKKILFYALNLTWGGIMNIIGGVVALVLYAAGKRPERHGLCWCFTVGKSWGGVSFGLVMLVCSRAGRHTHDHEHGHAIQNAIYGPAHAVLSVCSAARYHWRNLQMRLDPLKPMPPYDSFWFEGQATEWGEKFVKTIENERKEWQP